MSGAWWWAMVTLPVLVTVLIHRMRGRLAPGGVTPEGVEGDDPLVAWVVALREVGGRSDGDGTGRPEPTGVGWPSTPPVGSGSSGWSGNRRPRRSTGLSDGFVPKGPLGVLDPPARGAVVPAPSGAAEGTSPGEAENDHHERGGVRLPAIDQPPDRTARMSALWTARPRRVLLLTGVLGAGVGGLLAGPAAAAALGGYGILGVRAVLRRSTAGRAARDRRARLDQLGALAADLRVGLPVPVAAQALISPCSAVVSPSEQVVPAGEAVMDAGRPTGSEQSMPGGTVPGRVEDRLGRLARAAVRLAERTGAPLADLVERIEADARSTDRGLAAAAAQAAGARATAWLLAALPLGGIGLGYGIGVDPLQVMLHTPVGTGCAIAAVSLQVIGLLWAERLAYTPGEGR